MESWLESPEEPASRGQADTPGARPRRRAARSRENVLPNEVTEELARAVGRQGTGDLSRRMAVAAQAYERDRYADAARITRELVRRAPGSASVRELHGLACYRLGRWREAARSLEAARERGGGDPSQLPVIMDCWRAQGQGRKVEALWEELRASSPSADVLAEGRLVLAADRADRGDLDGAIDLLVAARAARNLPNPAERHLRQWYLLADLYERAGDLPRARELFARVVAADPDLADASRRLAELGRAGRRRSGRG